MKLEMKHRLLDKYFKGDTLLEEEKMLKAHILEEENSSSEKDIFEYFQKESDTPDNLEEMLFSQINAQQNDKKKFRRIFYSVSSAAATILIFLTLFLNVRNTKNAKLENDFFVMEQALFQISESIQPEEENEMMVLWVDDNVEIIIN